MSFPIGPFRRLPLGGGTRFPPFFPLTLSHLELYLDSRLSLSGFADGANVTTWVDQSGHSPTRDAIHSTTGLVDPTMGRGAANLTPRGVPTVVWKGNNDAQAMESRGTFVVPNPTLRGHTHYWYGKTLQKTAPVPYSFVNQLVFDGDPANWHFSFVMDSGGLPQSVGWIDDAAAGNPHRFSTSASIQNNYHLHTVVLPSPNNNTVNGRYYIDGVQIAQVSGPAVYKTSINGVSGYVIGNSFGFNVSLSGNTGFHIWYSDTHSDATIALFALWSRIFWGF